MTPSTEQCTACGHIIIDHNCAQCLNQLATHGIKVTQFGTILKGYAAEQYSGSLLDSTIQQQKPPLIVQLLGFARAGKDFTATQLKLYYGSIGKSVQILSYATPLKQITAALFELTLEQLDDYKNRANEVYLTVTDCSIEDHFVFDTSFRTILQRMGNEAIKPIFGDNVWAQLMQQTISNSTADVIIIPDCRFQVERQAIGGITVRVVNSALPAPSQHASELELADTLCMYMLDNTNYQATSADIAVLAERILHAS